MTSRFNRLMILKKIEFMVNKIEKKMLSYRYRKQLVTGNQPLPLIK